MGAGFYLPHREKKDQERRKGGIRLLQCVVIVVVLLSLLSRCELCTILLRSPVEFTFHSLFRQNDAVLPAVEMSFTEMNLYLFLTLWYPIQSLLMLSPLFTYFLTLSLPFLLWLSSSLSLLTHLTLYLSPISTCLPYPLPHAVFLHHLILSS